MSFWILAKDWELLIDLDDYMRPAPSRTGASRGPWGEVFFRRRLGDAIRAGRLDVQSVYLDRSNSAKHWHAIVVLYDSMPVMERLAWQLRLGSDLMRAQADIMRAARGISNPSLLIRNEPMADFYRPADRECECTRKHDTREQFELGERACSVWRELRGMTPYELFGPTTDGDYRGAALPIGNVPLELILAVERTKPEPRPEPRYTGLVAKFAATGICPFCSGPEPCIKQRCIDAALALADFYAEEDSKK